MASLKGLLIHKSRGCTNLVIPGGIRINLELFFSKISDISFEKWERALSITKSVLPIGLINEGANQILLRYS